LIFKGDTSITWTEDFFLTNKSKEFQNKALLIFNGFPALLGIIFLSICLVNPWVALIGYSIYIATSINPVKSLNRLLPNLAKIVK
jgi:hypothetical protein